MGGTMDKLKKRSEVTKEESWDLTPIFPNTTDFYQEYDEVMKLVKKFSTYQEHMMDSASTLYETLEKYYEILQRAYKLSAYASLTHDEDLNATLGTELVGHMEQLSYEISKVSYFIEPTLMKYSYDQIKEWMNQYKNLGKYHRFFDEIFRMQPHYLDEQEERLLSKVGNAIADVEEISSVLSDSDIRFPMIHDEDGNEVRLTDTNYRLFIRSSHREVRKQAFTALYQTYEQFKNTFALTLKSLVKKNVTMSQIRNFPSAIEASLNEDEVPLSVYDNLIQVVRNNLDALHDYYQMKKDILGYDAFHLYDTYANLIQQDSSKKYSYEEAKKLVLEATSVLGKEYTSILEKAFQQKWVDIYPNEGKRSGAYSGGSYDTYPYVLLNFQGDLDSVSTLAHELGHSVHSYYTRTNNEFVYGNYSIFVAEVASTVNELLLAKYLLKVTKNPKEKLNILNDLLELFKGTIFRQTMFAEFEKEIYACEERQEVLTAEKMSNIYYQLNKDYFGNQVIVDKEIQYEWCRVPHFYYNFYVYKYATGLSSACYIVQSILSGKKNAKENYIEFLKQGDRVSPIEELKIAGVDITKKEVIESAISMFRDIIEEFKTTYLEYTKAVRK